MELFKATIKTFALVFKRLYDILTTYLLFWVVYFASIAAGIHYGLERLWLHLGVANPALLWEASAAHWGLEVGELRLAFFVATQALIFMIARRPMLWLQPLVEGAFDRATRFFERVTRERLSLRLLGESTFSALVSALLIPFVIQPTLLRGNDVEAWTERATNLASGRASVEIVDSVLGFYNRFYHKPIVARGVEIAEVDAAIEAVEKTTKESDQAIAGKPLEESPVEKLSPKLMPTTSNPVMDRWDPTILSAVADEPELFAYVKAFMYVESAGRQYAVSRTGCSGLMQFCAGTARSQPYRDVFGRGTVYACGCRGTRCEVPRDVQRVMESGDLSRIEEVSDQFPCELTDARFDPDRAIRAGTVYVERLHRAFGGNIYLMYVGYNSGPAVARRVWNAVEHNPEASIADIQVHLSGALRPYYGSSADARARSLTKVHLPKIQRALERYEAQAGASVDVAMVALPQAR